MLVHVDELRDATAALLAVDRPTAIEIIDGLEELSRTVLKGTRGQGPGTRGKHWLCVALADVADALDPGVQAGEVVDVVVRLLHDEGVPLWVAALIGRALTDTFQRAAVHAAPTAQFAIGLRLLRILLCPAPDACPAGDRLVDPVQRALLGTVLVPDP
jgi:hypothetical protein